MAAYGHMDTSDAAKQSSILQNLRQGLEQGIVEQRLSVIEDQILRLAANRSTPILLNSHALEDKGSEHEPTKIREN